MGKKLSLAVLGMVVLFAAVLLADSQSSSLASISPRREARRRALEKAGALTRRELGAKSGASTATTFTVTNTADSGPGSLRQAIANANTNPGLDTIVFNIPGSGVQTIFPLSQLPPLSDPSGVLIDGLSQPGASCGSDPPSTSVLLIEIDGANAGSAHGLWVTSSNNEIRGLVINNFEQDGICIEGGLDNEYACYNRIHCNFIGTDPSGSLDKGNGRNQASLWAGVMIKQVPGGYACENFVEENLISGNYADGIAVWGPELPGDVYLNHLNRNYIGTDITGTVDVGNDHEGICLCEGTHDNDANENLISGNDYEGVGIQGYNNIPYGAPILTTNNTIANNTIGLDVNLNPLPNTMAGVAIGEYGQQVWGCATNNRVVDNIIAENGGGGVIVSEDSVDTQNADQNLISTNSIYENTGLGIDLGNDGVTLNDPADLDNGPNQEMNFPVITKATFFGGNTIIAGTLDTPSPEYTTIEVFKARLDPSGYGEGETFVGSTTPDATGNWTLTVSTLSVGDYVTATATDSYQNTSEFSESVEVKALDTCEYYKPAYVDYAPAGMPDFDQKQNNWFNPFSGAWTHCGPVALANCFWWFDSKFDSSTTPPPAIADNYPLVQNYHPLAILDDHDTSNVVRFVDSLALYCNTSLNGTFLYDLASGAQNWLNKVGLGSKYTVRVMPVSSGIGFEYIRKQVRLSQDVILLLGFWQETLSEYCERVGGHYVTVAGVCPDGEDSALCLSDPYFDLNEGNPPGGPAHGADVHNDAQYVSGPHGTMHHDKYYVIPALCQPSTGDPWEVEILDYAVNAANVVDWAGLNPYDTLMPQEPPNTMPIHTLIEYAIVICPTAPEPTEGGVKHNTDGFNPIDGDPRGTKWHELWPSYCENWTLTSWNDNGDGVLSFCDTVDFTHDSTGFKLWEHIEQVTPTITVTTLSIPPETLYLDGLAPNPMCTTITYPLGSYWHEVYPTYSTIWQITGWTDNGNGYLDSCDYLEIESIITINPMTVHVEAVETDIVTTPLPTPGGKYRHNQDGYFPPDGDPSGTQWHELWPNFCDWWELEEWRDNGDGILSYCDTLKFHNLTNDSVSWEHVEEVMPTIKVAMEIDTLYLDFLGGSNPTVKPIPDPINTYWHQVWPNFSIRYRCVGWNDNGNDFLDSCDYIDLLALNGPDSGTVATYHVEEWETDIITSLLSVPYPDTCEYYKQGYLDFCPNGMPDFDQKQDGWVSPATGNWSWCGPVALSNCIWWFDSKFEPSPVDPRPFYPDPASPPLNDGYPLVQSYDPAGVWDDHDTNNVIPFIQQLAPMCKTDVTVPGTSIWDLDTGFQNWIAAAGLADKYTSYVVLGPDYLEIKDSLLACQDIILLLGFYELIDGNPENCQWLGGHYVTVAGVCTTTTDICISDPMFDANEGEPPAGSAHGSSVHNDASLVSGPHGTHHHDRYHLEPNVYPCPSPAQWMVTNYPNTWPDIMVFENENPLEPMSPVTYYGGPIVVLVDAALIICPLPTVPTDTAIILDTVYNIKPDGTLPAGPELKFMMRWKYSSGDSIRAFINSFRVYSPDGATWDPIVIDTMPLGWTNMFDALFQFSYFSVNGSGADTVAVNGLSIFSDGLIPPFDSLVWWIETKVDTSAIGKHLCLDSCSYPPSG